MKMSIRKAGLCFSAALLLATAAHAEYPNLKPGLWEMKMQNAGGAGQPDMEKAMKHMQAALAKMPPEQRKMMEEKMGMAMGGSGGGIRVCLTDEDIKRQDIPMGDSKCSSTVKSRSAKHMRMTYVCAEPPSTGEVEAIFESPTSYLVKMKGTSNQNGKVQSIAMNTRATHVSSDCGGVKPQSEVRKDFLKSRPAR